MLDLERRLEREHVENFINSPGLYQLIDGQLPLSREQLEHKLYNPKTSYSLGKQIEYILEGPQALDIHINPPGITLAINPDQLEDSEQILNDALKIFLEHCSDPIILEELQEIRSEPINYDSLKAIETLINQKN